MSHRAERIDQFVGNKPKPAMTASELIQALQELPPGALVYYAETDGNEPVRKVQMDNGSILVTI